MKRRRKRIREKNSRKKHTSEYQEIYKKDPFGEDGILEGCDICGPPIEKPGENWSSASSYPWTKVVDHWGGEEKCFKKWYFPRYI